MLMTLNRRNSGVKGVEPGKEWRQRHLTEKKAVLTAFNRKNNGGYSVEPEK